MRISAKTASWGLGTLLVAGVAVLGKLGLERAGVDAEPPEGVAEVRETPKPAPPSRPAMEKPAPPPVVERQPALPPPVTQREMPPGISPNPPLPLPDIPATDPELQKQAQRAEDSIRELCGKGQTQEAWALIDPNRGEIRERSIAAFFRHARLSPAELLSMLDKLPSGERGVGLFSYWTRFTPEEFVKQDLADFPVTQPVDREVLRMIFEQFTARIHDPGNPAASDGIRRELLAMAVARINARALDYPAFKTLLERDPSRDGFAYWEALKAVDPSFKQGERSYDGTESIVIRAMTAFNPEKTMALAGTVGNSEARFLHIAFMDWLGIDHAKAKTWYETNQANFTPGQLDSLAVGFVRNAVRTGDYPAAISWFQKIQQPGWKRGLSYEKQMIRQAVPDAVLD